MPWKCPKCCREFSKTNQDHYCVKPQTIDEYIAAQEESIRPRLIQLRSIIQDAIPDAEERISWSMPTFWKGTNLIHFAVFKKHIGIYPGEEAAARKTMWTFFTLLAERQRPLESGFMSVL